MPRDDFSGKVISVLGQRAAYKCSNPNCQKLTIGPSDESTNKIVNSGIAAHITAAAPGGPRYNSMISDEERSSIDNGIWLCGLCANIVDKDECKYTVELLKKWKSDHEKRIQYMQSGINLTDGTIVKITIKNLARIISRESINLGQTTVFFGKNGTGKSLVCDLLTSLIHKDYLDRWIDKKNDGSSTFEIEFFVQELTTIAINIRDKHINYSIDGTPMPLIYPPYYVLYIHQLFNYNCYSDMTLIDQMADYYRLPSHEFTNVINFMRNSPSLFIDDIKIDSSKLLIKIDSKSEFISYLGLSGGEQRILTIEIALRIAMFFQKFKSTILILDNIFSVLDISIVNHLLNMFKERKFRFQSILTFSCIEPELDLTGLDLWNFIESEQGVTIHKSKSQL